MRSTLLVLYVSTAASSVLSRQQIPRELDFEVEPTIDMDDGLLPAEPIGNFGSDQDTVDTNFSNTIPFPIDPLTEPDLNSPFGFETSPDFTYPIASSGLSPEDSITDTRLASFATCGPNSRFFCSPSPPIPSADSGRLMLLNAFELTDTFEIIGASPCPHTNDIHCCSEFRVTTYEVFPTSYPFGQNFEDTPGIVKSGVANGCLDTDEDFFWRLDD